MGVLGDWSNPYLTLDKRTEANTVRSLAKIYANGFLYQGSKPVHWCIESSSALAEAEVEYKDIISSAVCVNFKILNIRNLSSYKSMNNELDVFIPIWTTTPWTIPVNKALAYSDKIKYSVVQIGKDIENIISKGDFATDEIVNELIKNIYLLEFLFLHQAEKRQIGRCQQLQDRQIRYFVA